MGDIIVTGASGFIGRNTVMHLIENELFGYDRLLALDRVPPQFDNPRVVNVPMDLARAEEEELQYIMKDAAVVVHLAAIVDTRGTAEVARSIQRVNVDVTRRIARASANAPSLRRFIFLSSVAALLPVSPYGKSKVEAESILRDIIPAAQLVILRPHVVYGAGDPLGTELVSWTPRWMPVVMVSDVSMSVVGIDAFELGALVAACASPQVSFPEGRVCFVGEKMTFRRLIEDRIIHRHSSFFILPALLVYLIALLSELINACLKSRSTFFFFRVFNRNALHYVRVEEPQSLGQVGRDMEDLRSRLPPFPSHAGMKAAEPRVKSRRPCAPSTIVTSPASLGPLKLRSRIIKCATFECMEAQDLAKFHARFARANVGLCIASYGAVCKDGKTFNKQLCFEGDEDKLREQLKHVAAAVHEAGGLVGLQLTHAGAFADTDRAVSAKWGVFNPLTYRFSHALTLSDEQRIAKAFEKSVHISHEAGLDAVEVHCGHGYLLSQCIRAGKAAFAIDVVRRACVVAHGHGMAVLVKMNIDEPLSTTVPLARAFIEAGADLIVPSGGHIMEDGLGMMRGGCPTAEMAKAQKDRLIRLAIYLLGPFIIRKHQYREAFYRSSALTVAFLARIPMESMSLIGGVQRRETAISALEDSHFAFVCLGRALLRDPDWAQKASDDEVRQCDQCNRCIVGPTMKHIPITCVTSALEGINDW